MSDFIYILLVWELRIDGGDEKRKETRVFVSADGTLLVKKKDGKVKEMQRL